MFFDVLKAFDKVWHAGLLYKLFRMGVPDCLIHTIKDFLTDRSFRYRVDGTLSTSRQIKAGVPQGSVLSPTLFSLFTSDIPTLSPAKLALFADDTALYVRGVSLKLVARLLQTAANTIGEWFCKWGIEVNPAKSAAMLFSRGSGKISPPALSLYGKNIPWVNSVRYLGLTFDKRLTFQKHVR